MDIIAIPTIDLGDGRTMVSLSAAVEEPAIRAFCERFPDYYRWDEHRQGWIETPATTEER